MNATTISKWAEHQSNFTYSENSDDEVCSCDSYESDDSEISSFYVEKRQKLLNRLEMKTKSPKNINKNKFASQILPISPKRIHGYKTFKVMVLGAANVGKNQFN